jgi:ATP-dependent RNA helicase DDX18/HAS1
MKSITILVLVYISVVKDLTSAFSTSYSFHLSTTLTTLCATKSGKRDRNSNYNHQRRNKDNNFTNKKITNKERRKDNDHVNNDQQSREYLEHGEEYDNGSSSSSLSKSSVAFFSQKSLSDPSFTLKSSTALTSFQELCLGAGITQPSKIQALAWPILLEGKSSIVADQTGSGKTLAYLLPVIQRMMESKNSVSSTNREYGSPKLLILAPTAELADQIKVVCDKTTANLSTPISTRVITSSGAYSTNIRDQIRMLGQTQVDILISTPGRVATILRSKNTSLNLANLQSIVLDEVDVLLIDETFGPQLRTIGAASPVQKCQFIFVTATLPNEIIETVQREFQDVSVISGPGLHRVALNLKEHLVDVSVPSTQNNNLDLCFEYKAKELKKALRNNRCKRTLVFCNTVESCRKVENLIRRLDRKGRLFNVGAYHNAMTPEARRRNLNVFAKGLDHELKDGSKESVDHVLVCTDRAARGVDFDSSPVDHVIIFDFPQDPAEYVRRVGRTARAGRTGTSTVFAYAWQLPIARKIMGSKLESYSVAAHSQDDDEGEFTQKQRRRAIREKDKMIRGNIEKGSLWK